MASPHTAATVALMWSAAPALSGEIAATIELLDATAADVDDTSCGGTPAKNNVWGEGRLSAFAAVTASPRGTVGSLEGTVSDAATGQPVVGASVHVEGPLDRMTQTDSAGFYRFPALSIGDYTIGVHRFAYLDRAAGAWVAEGMTTDEILTAYPDLDEADVREALRFAAAAVRERELPLASTL
jgi:hypothetical protein